MSTTRRTGSRSRSLFIRAANGGLEIDVPRGERPATTLVWRMPPRPNALERNRARAHHVAYCGMVAYTFLLKAFEYLRKGPTAMAVPYDVPVHGIGAGFWEAGRGTLTHHVVVDGGRIGHYRIVTPSTWRASTRDPFGAPGPYEEAALNTPLLEEFERPEDFTGIDMSRSGLAAEPPLAGVRILVVEDGEDDRVLLEMILRTRSSPPSPSSSAPAPPRPDAPAPRGSRRPPPARVHGRH